MSPTSTSGDTWKLAARAEKMNPSVIREILKVTEKPGIISFAGGLPSSKTFPVSEFTAACTQVLTHDAQAALQYAASEGFALLREMVAARLPWNVDPEQILITTGSQQGLDLVAKILIDADSRVLVETPTYLGALQAFTPMEPEVVSVASDAEGVDLADLASKVGSGANKARFLYVLPNFQNPTGRTMTEARRAALVAKAAELGLPLIEDNPYGDLWFDAEPPAHVDVSFFVYCVYLLQGISLLRERPKGFPFALWKPSVPLRMLLDWYWKFFSLCTFRSSKQHRKSSNMGVHCEGVEGATADIRLFSLPFGRVRRRETPAKSLHI